MGPSIEGLESLVRVPYGCGEQNMISFTPNIFVRRYLDNVNRLDNDIKSRTTANMESGMTCLLSQYLHVNQLTIGWHA